MLVHRVVAMDLVKADSGNILEVKPVEFLEGLLGCSERSQGSGPQPPEWCTCPWILCPQHRATLLPQSTVQPESLILSVLTQDLRQLSFTYSPSFTTGSLLGCGCAFILWLHFSLPHLTTISDCLPRPALTVLDRSSGSQIMLVHVFCLRSWNPLPHGLAWWMETQFPIRPQTSLGRQAEGPPRGLPVSVHDLRAVFSPCWAVALLDKGRCKLLSPPPAQERSTLPGT